MSKELTPKEARGLRYIRNALVHGQAPSVRDLQRQLGYSSPNSANFIIQGLIEKDYLRRRPDRSLRLVRDMHNAPDHERTVDVPLVGTAPCGAPLLAEENLEAMIPVSVNIARPPHKYFLLRALGDSMNKAGINDGDLVLVRQQPDAENGDRVVALIDDEATIKVIKQSDDTVTLVPRSSNKEHQPMILRRDFRIQGVVMSVIPIAP